MSTQNNKRKLDDAYGLTFDLQPDMMTEVFSHVQCVRTRHSLARVSKLWREASKPAAAYPLRFDFGAFPDMPWTTRRDLIIDMLDNDEALSLPYERVVGLLGEAAEDYLHENGCPWDGSTCDYAAERRQWDCLQYAVDNKCPTVMWEYYAKNYARHLR